MGLNLIKLQTLISCLCRYTNSRLADQHITVRNLCDSGKFLANSFCQRSSTHNTIRNVCAYIHCTIHQVFLTKSQFKQMVNSYHRCCRI